MTEISERGIMELVAHEGIVLEAYKDSVGVWTWGIGITSASGHNVERYIDNPQTLERVFEIYIWALQRYETDVDAAFGAYELNENERAAAVSFHYNTGAIKSATWVKQVKAGDMDAARVSIMNWKTPASIIPRREAERDLFFDAAWTGVTTGTVYEVYKPSYSPNWGSATQVDISEPLDAAMDEDGPTATDDTEKHLIDTIASATAALAEYRAQK